MATVGAVIIGDEVLSGKVEDANTPVLIQVLRERGVRLRRLAVVGDEPSAIAEEVRLCSDRYDHVITSGGIGPTHDDRTMEGIARAFHCSVVREPRLVGLIREHLGDRTNEAALKMAEVPEGARVVEDVRFPLVAFRNIFILPGVPAIFRRKLAVVAGLLEGTPPVTEQVVLGCYESDVAAELSRVEAAHDAVTVGSYPQRRDGRDVVLVTLESDSGQAAAAALRDLLARLPAGVVLQVCGGPLP